MEYHGLVKVVVEQTTEDYLITAASISDDTLFVGSVEDFLDAGGTLQLSDGTNTETATYTAIDWDLNSITLSAGIANNFAADDTYVRPIPTTSIRYAYVLLDGETEALKVRVPYSMVALLPLGIRDEGYEESVIVTEMRDEYILDDILGQTPVIVGTSIGDGTVPTELIGDLTATGGLNYIALRWTAVNNDDPVTYDVHVSTTTGFTPDASTLVGSTDASMIFIRTLPDGTGMAYDTTYYFVVIPRDNDGEGDPSTEANGRMNQAATGDIAFGAITGEKLYSDIILSSNIKTAEAGRRVEMRPAGITLYNSAGKPIVDIPTDETKNALFSGEVRADGLTVTGDATFSGGPGTVHINNATDIVLETGLQPPTSPPILDIEYPIRDTFYSNYETYFQGLAYTATGLVTTDTPAYYTIELDYNGDWSLIEIAASALTSAVRTKVIGGLRSWQYNLTVMGSNVWILGTSNYDEKVWLHKVALGSWTLTSYEITDDVKSGYSMAPQALYNDGTYVYVIDRAGANADGAFRLNKFNSSGVYQSRVTTDYDPGNAWYVALAAHYLSGDIHVTYWNGDTTPNSIFSDTGGVRVFNASGVSQSDDHWQMPWAWYTYLTHDGTNFQSLDATPLSAELITFSDWTWGAGDSSTYWIGYSYSAAGASCGTLDTAITTVNQGTVDVDETSEPPSVDIDPAAAFDIRIDSEDMRVTDRTLVSGSTYTYTIERGINGTTPATHLANATVTIQEAAETTVSPRSQIEMVKRAYLFLTSDYLIYTYSGYWNGDGWVRLHDPDNINWYINRGASEPTGGSPTRFSGYRITTIDLADDADQSIRISTFDNVGSPPENAGSNTFHTGDKKTSIGWGANNVLFVGSDGQLVIPAFDADPSNIDTYNPTAGTQYYNTSDDVLYVWVNADVGGGWSHGKPFIGARMYESGAVTHGSTGNWRRVEFNTVSYQVLDMADTDTDKIYVPANQDGIWSIRAHIVFAGDANGSRRAIRIKKNEDYTSGTTPDGNGTVLSVHEVVNPNAQDIGVFVEWTGPLVEDDGISIEAFQNSGGNLGYMESSSEHWVEAEYKGPLASL